MAIDEKDIKERVDRGIALLDEKRPGWAQEIDLSKLELQYPCKCVLGQLYGEDWTGARVLSEDAQLGLMATVAWEQPRGFMASDENTPEEWHALEQAWVVVIALRQAAEAKGESK